MKDYMQYPALIEGHHEPLARQLEHSARMARIPMHFIGHPLTDWIPEEDARKIIGWAIDSESTPRNLLIPDAPFIPSPYAPGPIMQAITGALVRNYKDARYYTFNELRDHPKDERLECQFLILSSLCPMAPPSNHELNLFDSRVETLLRQGTRFVIYTGTQAMMKTVFGDRAPAVMGVFA